jgi:hypothetical protein
MFFTISLKLNFRDGSDTLKGRAFVTLQFTQTSNKFWLDLVSPDGKGKGMVAYKVREGDQVLSSTHGNDSLIIWLKKHQLKKMKPGLLKYSTREFLPMA